MFIELNVKFLQQSAFFHLELVEVGLRGLLLPFHGVAVLFQEHVVHGANGQEIQISDG